jgi:PhzF family phenazine biosynthesis protein
VRVRRGDRLAFAAPPLVRSGPVSDDDLATIVSALRIEAQDVVDAAWVDNGADWVAVLLADADAVLGLRPDFGAFGGLDIGAVGLHPAGSECAVEVRAFAPEVGIPEDPVTGSLNAGLAQWLAGSRLPTSYVAAQGTAIGRRGRAHVSVEGDEVWVGGDTRTTITGRVDL